MQQLSIREYQQKNSLIVDISSPGFLLIVALVITAFFFNNLLYLAYIYIALRSSGTNRKFGMTIALLVVLLFLCLNWVVVSQIPPPAAAGIIIIFMVIAISNLSNAVAVNACLQMNAARLSSLLNSGFLSQLPGKTGLFWRDCRHALTHIFSGDTQTAEYLLAGWQAWGDEQPAVDIFLLFAKRLQDDLQGAAVILDRLMIANGHCRWCPDAQLVELAMIYVELGQWRKAINLLDSAQPKIPPSLNVLYIFLGADSQLISPSGYPRKNYPLTKFETFYYEAVREQMNGNVNKAINDLETAMALIGSEEHLSDKARAKARIMEKRIGRRLRHLQSTHEKMIDPDLTVMAETDRQWAIRQLVDVENHWRRC